MSTWDELNQAAGGTVTKKTAPASSSTGSGWKSLNTQAEEALAPKTTKALEVKTPATPPASALNQAGQDAFFSNPYSKAPLPKSQAPKTVKINELPPVNINTKTANSTQAIPDATTPNIGINEVIGAPVGILGGVIGGAVGAIGGSIKAQSKGMKGEAYWQSVGKDSVELAKEMYKNGSDIGSAGVKLGVATAVAPELVGAYFTAMTGKGIYDTVVQTKDYYQKLKSEGADYAGLQATDQYLKNGGAEGWRLAGLDEDTIKTLNDNTFFNSIGNVLLYGGAYFATKGTLKASEGPVGKLSDFLTKDRIVEYKLPETVKISPQEVYDIYSGKAGYENNLSVQEKGELLSSLGLTSEEIANARKSGISIEKPTEVVVKMADKPWFSKIKNLLNIESAEKVVGTEKLGGAKTAPAGLLEGPKVQSDMALADLKVKEIIQAGGDLPDPVAEQLSTAQVNFNRYLAENKQPVIDYSGPEVNGTPTRLSLDVVQFDKNQFGVSYEVTYGQGSLMTPFDSSQTFKSQEAAISNAKEKILDWSRQQNPADEASKLQLQEIVNQISSKSTQSVPQPMQNKITSVNPTGGVFSSYIPEKRMSAELGKNITTLDKTMGKSPNETITIYRGAPSNQGEINPGDFVTTNEQLAKDYAGTGVVLKKEVKLRDILDDKTDPLGEEYIYRPESTQKERVQSAIKEEAKTIKEIAKETKIVEPNVRRILGVGAKDGTFERIDKGVYRLRKDGQDIAYIHPGDSVEVLPRLAKEGFKADMIFLDIPYKTGAVTGGNRGAKFNFISVDQFKTIVGAVKEITKDEKTPVFYMYSQAKSGIAQMAKYTDEMLKAGFKAVAKGEYTKLQKDGVTRTRNMRGEPDYPEGIILFTRSGEFNKAQPDLNFKMVRPKGYQTEKPAEMLNQIIKMSTNEGDVVLDPFAGSGVTGEQAVKEGRQAVLVEKSQKAIDEHIKPRLEKAVAERAKQYPTIHEGGKVKMVEGEPVEIVKGVETFLHKSDGGWMVSESSTGRYIAESRSREWAVAKAESAINDVGVKKFKETIAAKKLKTNEITDFGEKIGGANKEAWTKRGLNTDDILKMNDREIARYLKKDNIWLKNYDQLANEGKPGALIMFIKQVRDSLTPKIAYRYSDNTPELKQARNEQYISFVKEVRDVVNQLKSVEDIRGFYRRFVTENGYAKEIPSESGYAPRLEYTDKQKNNPFLTDKFRRAASVSSGYELARLEAGAKSQQFGVAPENKLPSNLEIRFDSQKKDWFVARRSGRFGQILKSGLASEEEARNWAKENVNTTRQIAKKRFTPPQLAHIHRSGVDYRNGNTKNITGEDYLKTFGFKGGEFGNWLNAKDRQTSLNYGYDALMDLSDALGISRQDIALNKTLSIAFGSRGKAGAAAHYEPDRKVFNLTKMNGAGSTAHEWFHALEDYLGPEGKKLESFNNLKRALVYGPDGKPTQYKLNSIAADGVFGKAGGYWQSQEEMLARAFASYITDKTAGKSDYLSGHSEAAVFPDAKGEMRSAFPTGEERKMIDKAFDNFFNDLITRGTFQPLKAEPVRGNFSYSIKNVSDFENKNQGVQDLDSPFDGRVLYERLQKDMKRLGLNFDIALFDRIFTGEMAKKVVTDKNGVQTLRIMPEEAAGVVYNNRLALSKNALKFAEKHELIHMISNNLAAIPAFAKYDKAELLKEAQAVYGNKYLDTNPEEVLARGFEDFVYHRQTFTGKLKSFFSRLIYEIKQILNFTKRLNLKNFYEDVLYGKGKETVNLQAGKELGAVTKTGARQTVDFGRRGGEFLKTDFRPEDYVKEKVKDAKSAGEAEGGLLDKIKRLSQDAKAKLVDFTAPIEDTLYKSLKANNLTLKPSEDIHNQIDRVLRTPTLAGQFVKDTGFDKVIREVDNIDNLDQYLIAKHAVELEAKGIKTGRDLEKDQQLIEAFKGRYEAQAQKVIDYSHQILDYAVSRGLISPEFSAKLKETYPDYVPFKRVFNEVEQNQMAYGGKAVASLSRQSIIQKISGSERQIESPIGSLLQKTNDVFKQGEKNVAGKLLASYQKLPGNPFGLEEVTTERPVKIGEQTISYLDQGVKRTFVVNPDVARAAKALDVQRLNVLGQIFALPTRLARLGITSLNVPFIVSNVLKDQTTAFINSNHALRTSVLNPKVFVRALLEVAKEGELYQEIMRAGGSGTSYDISRNQVGQTIKRIRSGRSIFSKAKYTVTHPSELIRALEDIIGKSEEFTRTKQYLGTKEALLKQGLSEKEAQIGAARAYNEDTVNFARRGEWGQVLNSAFLYLNAGIQGTRNLLRNLKNKPAGTAVKIAVAALFPMAMATVYNLRDDKTRKVYEDIPEWEKQNNIIIIPPNASLGANGKYNVIKIPVSQEINNLTNFVRKSVEDLYGLSEVGFKDLASSLFGTVTPFNLDLRQTASQLTPQALKPTIEGLANTDLYSGSNIISKYMTNLPPELQVYDNTSGTARKIGSALGVSPLQVEHFLKATFGEIALQGENLSDKVLNALGYIPSSQVGGRGIIEGTLRRFATASAGAIEAQTKEDLNSALGDVSAKLDNAKQAFKPKFDEIQNLILDGKTDQAQVMVSNLSDSDYVLYKALKKVAQTKATNQAKIDIYPTYTKVQQLVQAGKTPEAQAIVDSLTDEQYKAYKSLKTSLEKNKNLQPGVETIAPEDQKGFFSSLALYAKAIGTDPVTAFNRIFTGQRITKLVNGTIIVERMPLEASQKIKKAQGGDNPDWKLEHIVSLELGGSNAASNLVLVPTSVWEQFTKADNELGQQLRDGLITKEEAQKKIREIKKDYIK